MEAAAAAEARGESFHAILLDCLMPGQDGIETARQIRKKVQKNLPVVMLTSYDWSDIEDKARAEDVQNALNAGMNGHLSKPIDMDAVKAILGRLRRGKDPQPPAGPAPKAQEGSAE